MNTDKKLSQKQIRTVQFLLLSLGGMFFIVYFFILSHQHTGVQTIQKKGTTTVFLQNQKLHIFDDLIDMKNSPDTVAIHGNYLLVTEPFIQTTHIYDVTKRKKTLEYKEILLDFDGNNFLYSKHGIDTFFNAIDLQTTCFGGYIKSPTEILCIVPKADDNLDNKLIAINPQTLHKTDIYSSAFTVSYVSYIDNSLYIGGYNLQAKRNVLLINGVVVPVPNRVSIIYQMGKNIFYGSFQSDFNNNTESYSLIQKNENGITTRLINKGEIVISGR